MPRDRATPHVRQPNRRELRRARTQARIEAYSALSINEREALRASVSQQYKENKKCLND